jgi:hypothetical protein
VEIIRLSEEDFQLLVTRFAEHGNSQRRMAIALGEAGAATEVEHLRGLGRLEMHFMIDLGSLCHRFQKRNDAGTHPLERQVLDFVASWRVEEDGARELWVVVDRVRQLRHFMEMEHPGPAESAKG